MYVILCGGGIGPEDLLRIFEKYKVFGEVGIDRRTTSLEDYVREWYIYFKNKRGYTPTVIKRNDPNILQNINIYFILGGDQSRYLDSVRNSGFHRKLLDLVSNKKIIIIGGTSAGAMVWGRLAIAYTEETVKERDTGRIITVEEPEVVAGLGILEKILGFDTGSIIVDTHFEERWRMQRLYQAVKKNTSLGIGINERSVVIIDGENLYVERGKIYLIFPKRTKEEIKGAKILECKEGEKISIEEIKEMYKENLK